MKKILVIGANPETTPIVKIAKDMGVYTIVTDNDPRADAKKIADKRYDVDGLDVEGLIKIGRDEAVDGVLVGVADLLISSYQKVCEALMLPCYATAEQVKVFTDKFHFKRKCEEFGIDGVPERIIYKSEIAQIISKLSYPVIIKPVDSCSGKGITLCYSETEAEMAIHNAFSWTSKDYVVAERYMTCDDVSIYYTIKDGIPYLSSVSDRYTCKTQGKLSPVCIGDVFPSKHTEHFLQYYNDKFCNMFQSMNMQNCVVYVSAFCENGKYYVYDPGFRLQGGGFHLILNAANHFDHREMLIQQALGENFGTENFSNQNDPYLHGQSAAVVWLLLKAGIVYSIHGIEAVRKMPEVKYIVQRFSEGETVKSEYIGTEKQVFARIFIVANDRADLIETVKSVRKTIEVYDEYQNNMLIDTSIPEFA